MSVRWERLGVKHPDKESAFHKTKKGQPHFFNSLKQWPIPLEKPIFGKAKGDPPQF